MVGCAVLDRFFRAVFSARLSFSLKYEVCSRHYVRENKLTNANLPLLCNITRNFK